ncbi:MAG: hypothetical protein AAGD32_10535 [Planctomycetota bacterium]
MTKDQGRLSAFPIAMFLAVSWTWVIGMHLPTVLMRDMGIGAWLVFALPNVIGAAAMGRLVPSAEASHEMEMHHGKVMQAFAIVTVAFHVYFAVAILRQWVGEIPALVAAAALVLCVVRPVFPDLKSAMRWSPAVWLASVLLVGVAVGIGGFEKVNAFAPGGEWVGLGIACLFGFALCPYLDPTFHSARQAAGVRGPQTFALGFGIFFLVMIGGTFLCASIILDGVPRWAVALLGGHVVWQSIFTVSVHVRGMTELHRRTCPGACAIGGFSRPMAVGLAGAVLLALVDGLATWFVEVPGRYDLPEIGYRVFLGFYGLIFPAYVWLAMFRRNAPPTRIIWIVYAVVVVQALPFFAYGFLGGSMIWVGVGMVPVLLGKLVLRSEQT